MSAKSLNLQITFSKFLLPIIICNTVYGMQNIELGSTFSKKFMFICFDNLFNLGITKFTFLSGFVKRCKIIANHKHCYLLYRSTNNHFSQPQHSFVRQLSEIQMPSLPTILQPILTKAFVSILKGKFLNLAKAECSITKIQNNLQEKVLDYHCSWCHWC